MTSLKYIAALLALLPLPTLALTNNLALTPPMGWNDWNSYGCGISEFIVTNNAGVMAANGMKAAGYQYVDVDDGWASSRDFNGVIQAYSISSKFPDGIPWLRDYVHGLGLKLGIYTDHGTNTCSSCISGETPPKDPGSYGYEYVDAMTYGSWRVDYLKEDNCNVPASANAQVDYGKMSAGLMLSGQPILFCLCGGNGTSGSKAYQSWSPSTGNYWRTTGDIGSTFASMISHIDPNSTTAFAAGPGRWNDPDMLEIGNGEFKTNLVGAQTHFSMWCEMAAPLIAGDNIVSMSAQSLAILTNSEAIAVDQDPAGEQGVLVGGVKDSAEVWSKPLGYDFTTRAVALLNRSTTTPAIITCNFTNLAFQPGTTATVSDLWGHTNVGTFTNSFTATVPPYATMLLKIVGTPIAPPAAGTNYLSDTQPIYAYTGSGTIVPDKSIGGNTITLGGIQYSHGIGVNSYSGVEYNLGGVCSRFQATIGIDDEVGNNGTVIFQVFADGTKIYDSGVITGSSASRAIDLDVTGVRRLTLGVGSDDDGTSNDHADWANALVIVTNTTPQVPETPADLVASPGNPVTLSWNNTLAALTYNIKRAVQSGGPYIAITNVPINTFTDSNVISGTTYYYVISAVSSIGESSNSAEASVTTCNVPLPPTNVTTAASSPSVTISWNASAGATSYSVYSFGPGTPPVLLQSGITATSYTDISVAGMGAVTNYYYVAAANACNQSGWYGFAAAVTPPATPTGLDAVAGNGTASLSWNATLGASGYNVMRSKTNGGPYTLVAGDVVGPSYLDAALTNGVTYYYVVTAINVGGQSLNSAQASVTPVQPVTAYWTNSITASAQSWNANANWTNVSSFPNSGGDAVIINAGLSAPQTINLNQAIAVGSMQIGDANGIASYTIAANGGSLTFGGTGTLILTQLPSSKGDILATPITLAGNLVIVNDSVNPLTLAGTLASSGSNTLSIGSGTLQVGNGTTNGNLGPVAVTDNGALVFNRSDNVNSTNVISGSGSLAQTGAGILTLSASNSYSGATLIQNGTLQINNNAACGPAADGAVTVANGGTLDIGGPNYANQGFALGAKQINVSGWGVNSNGAIVNSSATYQYANNNFVSVTMQGDTAIGGAGTGIPGNGNTPGRWDLRGTTSQPVTLSTGGHPYNLFKMGGNQIVFVNTVMDTNLANIDIRQGFFEVQGMTALGNPTNNLIVENGTTFGMFQGGTSLNKNFVLNGNGQDYTVFSEGNSNALLGPVVLNSGNCVFGGTKNLALSNSISGSGNLVVSNSTIFLTGINNTYNGNTIVLGGTLTLVGSSTISNSQLIVIRSGATLDASQRSDATLTLASGQMLAGNGTVKGNVVVSSGATFAPGIGTMSLNNTLTFNSGSTMLVQINKSLSPSNSLAQVSGNAVYGGTLAVTNVGTNAFAAGDSFKIFTAAGYSGAFTGVVPAIPGINLAWNTNSLGSDGTLSVVASPTSSPQIVTSTMNGNNFVFSGSNGVPGWPYWVLSSTNLMLPTTNWSLISTGAFDASGNFIFTNPVDAGAPQNFYLLELP